MPQPGPAMICASSITLTPARGPVFPVIADFLCPMLDIGHRETPPTPALPRKGGGRRSRGSLHKTPSPLTGEGWGGGGPRSRRGHASPPREPWLLLFQKRFHPDLVVLRASGGVALRSEEHTSELQSPM